MKSLRILITNNSLAPRGGTEMYVRDLAHALLRRGHFPVAYSPLLGEVADVLKQLTIPVVDDLNQLAVPPDIIHGHHHHETMTAALHFPNVPVVSVCHGWVPWPEQPVAFPTIMKHVAVDELCRERLFTTPGIDSEHVECIFNFVDCRRFSKLRTPQPALRKAFVFTNYAGRVPEPIAQACAEHGIGQVDIAGLASRKSVAKPEDILHEYDVVFAKARAAIEAMASGCAVVVTHQDGIAGLVTPENLPELRKLNFGVRTMKRDWLTRDTVSQALQKYDPDKTSEVSAWIRQNANLELAVDQWEALYRRALDRWESLGPSIPPEQRERAASVYLRSIAGYVKEARQNKSLTDTLRTKVEKLEGELVAKRERLGEPPVANS